MSAIRKLVVLAYIAVVPAFAFGTETAKDLLAEGRVDDAISTLRGQIGTSPQSADSYNLLCRAYYALQNWDAAISACQKAVEIEPNNSTYHLWLGRAYGEK